MWEAGEPWKVLESMAVPRVLILRAPGTNCDRETAFAFQQAGGSPEWIHINQMLDNPRLVDSFQILCIPGGFSYGDDIAAGKILANQIRHHLQTVLNEFRAAEKLILGICNGFQVLIKSGILLNADAGEQPATLTWNTSGKFEDRWVRLAIQESACVFLRGMRDMNLPIAHAEGKFVTRDHQVLARLEAGRQLVIRYCAGDGQVADQQLPFPENPNGSQANVAGVCDDTGRVLGLMPHPERYIDKTQHPRWTRGEGRQPGDGLALFRNAVQFFQ